MISSDHKLSFERILSDFTGKDVKINHLKNLSGGCIHHALKLETSAGEFFMKCNTQKIFSMFESEAKGLNLLKETHVIDIPEVYSYGSTDQFIYIILEYIEPGSPSKNYWENFGVSLAQLHKSSNQKFGLHFNNFIGALPQQNNFNENWISFFIEQRIEPQLRMALDSNKINGQTISQFQSLFKKLPELLVNNEKPSLLHGDLWNGNVLINQKGNATLIDPAVYYGNREIELAFTKLFGGFDDEFYESYQREFPMEKGYESRFDIYNLYPLLVHVNLFGGGYINSVSGTLRRFL